MEQIRKYFETITTLTDAIVYLLDLLFNDREVKTK
jgi:hypothetical protein